jgi:hypothetical protein
MDANGKENDAGGNFFTEGNKENGGGNRETSIYS